MSFNLAYFGRFVSRFTVGDDCWEWHGYRLPGGYGQFWMGKNVLAHRASYELLVGKIPAGLQVDHLCRNRACVNPKHLEPVTAKVNSNRSIHANTLKTHCPRNHPYEGGNLFYSKRGTRLCRECSRINARKYS